MLNAAVEDARKPERRLVRVIEREREKCVGESRKNEVKSISRFEQHNDRDCSKKLKKKLMNERRHNI